MTPLLIVHTPLISSPSYFIAHLFPIPVPLHPFSPPKPQSDDSSPNSSTLLRSFSSHPLFSPNVCFTFEGIVLRHPKVYKTRQQGQKGRRRGDGGFDGAARLVGSCSSHLTCAPKTGFCREHGSVKKAVARRFVKRRWGTWV